MKCECFATDASECVCGAWDKPIIRGGTFMKSVIITDPKGQKVLHIKRTKTGIDVIFLQGVSDYLTVKAIMDNNSVITVKGLKDEHQGLQDNIWR